VRNDFGYSVGGPIIKDRTFFFINNEYQRFRTTLTDSSIVPTAAYKSGLFTAPDGTAVDVRTAASPGNLTGLGVDPSISGIPTRHFEEAPITTYDIAESSIFLMSFHSVPASGT
jgi:hypothetical protein